jgi:hypothetical protein
MHISLAEILSLVGSLDDTPGNDTPRERFRSFLSKNVREVGELRDHIEECLRTSGDQYNKALQDLVNFIGQFLGFEVAFARYRGVSGEIGFDGHWKSPTGFHIVIEVKTSDTYTIKTSTLVGYIDELISSKRIPDWHSALGLYVLGRPDPEIKQLENAVIAERRVHQLRTSSIESLLSLAELMTEYDMTHGDALVVLRPSAPSADPIINLMARLVAQGQAESVVEEPASIVAESAEKGPPVFWITPVKDHENETALECVENLVGKVHIYAFGERTPGRKRLKLGDWICFYANTIGVVGHARVASAPERKPHPKVIDPESYPYTFRLESPKLYIDNPVILDAARRTQLDAFQSRDPERPWAWYVQGTHKITKHDFELLTRTNEMPKGRM